MLTDEDPVESKPAVATTSPVEATQPSTAQQPMLEPTVSSSPPVTVTSVVPVPATNPVQNDVPSQVEPLVITLQPRTGIRNLRGKPTTIPTGHLDIMVDGTQRAWTRVEKASMIRALAEFLPHEIPQLQAAVMAYRGDVESPEFKSLPKGTPQEIAKLQKM